jgi:hypothetical protein
MPLVGGTVSKDTFGMLIVVIDLAAIMIIVCFIYALDVGQNRYIAEFKAQTIEMSDFTIRVKNLPSEAEFGGKEEILKAELWAHFEELLLEEHKALPAIPGQLKQFFQARMPPTITHCDDLENAPAPAAAPVPPDCEVVDVTFGKQRVSDTEQLIAMSRLYHSLESNRKRMDKAQSPAGKTQYYQLAVEQEAEYEVLKQQYKESQRQKESSGGDQANDDGDRTIKYAYVVFRSMSGMRVAADTYNITRFERFLYLHVCCCCFRKQKQRIYDTYFHNRWLEVRQACLPDEIQW